MSENDAAIILFVRITGKRYGKFALTLLKFCYTCKQEITLKEASLPVKQGKGDLVVLDKMLKRYQPQADKDLAPCEYQWSTIHVCGHRGIMSSAFPEYLYVFCFQEQGMLVVPFAITQQPRATALLFSPSMKIREAPIFSAQTREGVLAQAFEYYPLPSCDDYSPPSSLEEDGRNIDEEVVYCKRGIYRDMRYFRLDGDPGILYLFPPEGGEPERMIALFVIAPAGKQERFRAHVFCIEVRTAVCQQEDVEADTLETLFDRVLSRERRREMRRFMLDQLETLCFPPVDVFLSMVAKCFACFFFVPLTLAPMLWVTTVDFPRAFSLLELPLKLLTGLIIVSTLFFFLLLIRAPQILKRITTLYGNRWTMLCCALLLLTESYALLFVFSSSSPIGPSDPVSKCAQAILFSYTTLFGWFWLDRQWDPPLSQWIQKHFAPLLTLLSSYTSHSLHQLGIYPYGVGMVPPPTLSTKLSLVREYLHVSWFGDEPYRRRIRIYQPFHEEGQFPEQHLTAIVCSAISPNWNKSKAACIATEVWQKECLPYPLIWIEHKRKRYSYDEFLYAHFCCNRNSCLHHPRWFYLSRYQVEAILADQLEDLGAAKAQDEDDDWEW
jgi:hypothetical protein